MGSVEGLYGQDTIHLADKHNLSNFQFLAVEEVHKLGVRFLVTKMLEL